MLKREIRFIYLFTYLFIYCSCSDNNKNDKKYSEDKTLKSNYYVNMNFSIYSNTYLTIKDSVHIYINSLLKTFQSEFISEWQLDSMVCINSEYDKLVAVILNSSGGGKGVVGDDAEKILGKKINNKWCFFKGAALIIPRDMYGKDSIHPLSFHELSQIARKEFLESSLIKNAKGEYIVNDKWVDEHFYNAGYDNFTHHKIPGMVSQGEEYQMPRDKEKTDSVHWWLITDKWRHKIDTNEYKPLHRNKMKNPAL